MHLTVCILNRCYALSNQLYHIMWITEFLGEFGRVYKGSWMQKSADGNKLSQSQLVAVKTIKGVLLLYCHHVCTPYLFCSPFYHYSYLPGLKISAQNYLSHS